MPEVHRGYFVYFFLSFFLYLFARMLLLRGYRGHCLEPWTYSFTERFFIHAPTTTNPGRVVLQEVYSFIWQTCGFDTKNPDVQFRSSFARSFFIYLPTKNPDAHFCKMFLHFKGHGFKFNRNLPYLFSY